MASLEGTVYEIYVELDYGWVRVEESDGDIVKIFIWSDLAEEYTPHQRITHGVWISLLREAKAHSQEVDVLYDDDTLRMFGLYVR